MTTEAKLTDLLTDFICAGYFLSRASQESRNSAANGEMVITASTCISDFLPNSWAFAWIKMSDEDRHHAALRSGFASQWKDFMEWVATRMANGEIRYPNVLTSVAVARELVHSFRIDSHAWHLLGLGLKRELVDRVIEEYKPRKEGRWTNGIYDLASAGGVLDSAGEFLGFDVLGLEAGGTIHSWICNLSEESAARQFEIHVNDPRGLLEKYSDAERLAAHLSDPINGAEPVPWFPWLLVKYSI